MKKKITRKILIILIFFLIVINIFPKISNVIAATWKSWSVWYVNQVVSIHNYDFRRNGNAFCVEHVTNEKQTKIIPAWRVNYRVIRKVTLKGALAQDDRGIKVYDKRNAWLAYILSEPVTKDPMYNKINPRAKSPVQNNLWRSTNRYAGMALGINGWFNAVGRKFLPGDFIRLTNQAEVYRDRRNRVDTALRDKETNLYNRAINYMNNCKMSEPKDRTSNVKVKQYENDGSYLKIGPFNWEFSGSLSEIQVKNKSNGRNVDGCLFGQYGGRGFEIKNVNAIKSRQDFYILIKSNSSLPGTINVTGKLRTREKVVDVYFLRSVTNKYQNIIYRTIKGEQNVETTFGGRDVPLIRNLRVIKADADDANIKLQNVGFIIRNTQTKKYVRKQGNNISYVDRKDATEFITDKNGKISVDGLSAGSYEATETKNPNYGYESNVGKVYKLKDSGTNLVIDEKKDSNKNSCGTNQKQTGNLQIVKKNKDSGGAMANVGYKIKDSEGKYIIGYKDSGEKNKLTEEEATGEVKLGSMSTTESSDDATLFKTGENGICNIYNIRSKYQVDGKWQDAKYTIEEVFLGKEWYNFEIDSTYTTYSYTENGKPVTKDNTNSVTVDVSRRNSNDSKHFTILTNEDRQKYVNLSGYVWEGINSGKGDVSSNLFNKDTDKLVGQVTVKLLDKDGNPVNFKVWKDENAKNIETYDDDLKYETKNEIRTDVNGRYEMRRVEIDKLNEYYVEFTYNGMSYKSLAADLLKENGSKAIDDNKREEFNKNFAIINNNESQTPEGNHKYDINYDTNESSSPAGTEEHKRISTQSDIIEQLNKSGAEMAESPWSNLNYTDKKDQASYTYGYDGQDYPINDVADKYTITANTKDAYLSAGGQNTGYLSDMYNAEAIRKGEINEIENINLGLHKREQPDITLTNDMDNVKTEINGYSHIYNYGKRNINSSSLVGRYGGNPYKDSEAYIRFGDVYGREQYTRSMYRSDCNEIRDTENQQLVNNELKLYATYKVHILNSSTSLKTKVNNIAYYFDSNYTIYSIGIGSNGEGIADGIANNTDIANLSVNDYKTFSDGKKYQKVIIPVNQTIESQNGVDVYITFVMDRQKVYNLVVAGNTGSGARMLDSVAEINSYSTFDDKGNIYAGIDKDSNPGNVKPEQTYSEALERATTQKARTEAKSTFEDDSDNAPTFILKLRNGERTITGKVFLDTPIVQGSHSNPDDLMTGQIRQGNGTKDDGEAGIPGVTVTLVDKTQHIVYTANPTGDDGTFTISEFIPGDYEIVYTWGDSRYSTSDYKCTIYGDPEVINPKDRWTKNTNPDSASGADRWYRDEKIYDINGNAIPNKFSDALDDMSTRAKIDAGQTEIKFSSQKSLEKMNSTTPKLGIPVEYLDQFGKNGSSTENGENTQDKNIGQEMQYNINDVDFGIIERARQQMTLKKRISRAKLTLANGQTITDIKIDENGTVTGSNNYIVYKQGSNGVNPRNGFLRVEIDNELMQGAKLEVWFELKVANTSEIDYATLSYQNDEARTPYFDDISQDYYKFGIVGPSYHIVKLKATAIMDYLDSKWGYDQNAEENSNWTIKQLKDLTNETNSNNIVLSSDVLSDKNIKNKLILYTNKFAETELSPQNTDGANDASMQLYASKLLSTSEDIDLNNDTEINQINKNGGSSLYNEIPGNYKVGDYEKATDTTDTSVYNTHEVDDYMSERVTVTPSTGGNRNYILPVAIGVSALAILGIGTVIIKKRALGKDDKN